MVDRVLCIFICCWIVLDLILIRGWKQKLESFDDEWKYLVDKVDQFLNEKVLNNLNEQGKAIKDFSDKYNALLIELDKEKNNADNADRKTGVENARNDD